MSGSVGEKDPIKLEMAKLLKSALVEMSLEVDDEKQQKLLDYVALIHKWNQVHNLTAVREQRDMITLHILDSLSVLPYIACRSLLDVGAGAGLPSIPLAICTPELQITAIDAVQKKVSFMRQAKAQLRLTNFNVVNGRVEDQNVEQLNVGKKFEVIISRAFSEIGLFIKLTKHLIAEDGKWLAMKGVIPEDEFKKSGIKPADITVLKVAGLDAKRHLITVRAIY